jgi:muconolactone delta-isomerase
MKQHNKVKRLEAKQKAYDRLMADNPSLKQSYRRPGD